MGADQLGFHGSRPRCSSRRAWARSVKARSACTPKPSAVMAKERGRSFVTTALRNSTGCAFHRKTSGSAALPGDSTRTHRQARHHDGHRSTSVSRFHTRSASAGIVISLQTSIGVVMASSLCSSCIDPGTAGLSSPARVFLYRSIQFRMKLVSRPKGGRSKTPPFHRPTSNTAFWWLNARNPSMPW